MKAQQRCTLAQQGRYGLRSCVQPCAREVKLRKYLIVQQQGTAVATTDPASSIKNVYLNDQDKLLHVNHATSPTDLSTCRKFDGTGRRSDPEVEPEGRL